MDVAALTILAALVRLVMLVSTVDAPGDGPVRALMAYSWAKAPHVVLHGVWPPGFMYATGLVSSVLPVWIAGRLLNVALGTATVPLVFLAVAPAFGPVTAILAAAIVAVFPLHVELSASSLSEVSAVFEILLGMVFLMIAAAARTHGRGHTIPFALAIGGFATASMTRYEVWCLLPVFPWYYWLRTRNAGGTATMAALLLAFPVTWLIGNQVY